jgi:hypothetical protein
MFVQPTTTNTAIKYTTITMMCFLGVFPSSKTVKESTLGYKGRPQSSARCPAPVPGLILANTVCVVSESTE